MIRRSIAASVATALACPGAAAHTQSALDPAAPQAQEIALMWWIMAAGSAAILLLVMALVLYGLRGRPQSSPRRLLRFVYFGGIAFPVITLTALIVYTLVVGVRLAGYPPDDSLRIEVIARQWWWEVRYPAEEGGAAFVTANEIHVPIGRTAAIAVSSPDVIHSFWVPNLAGKIDAIPGRTNRIVFQAERAGVYRGQCAEYCGLQHALMAFHVVAESEDEYAAWTARQRAPVSRPALPLLARGYEVFMENGCGACHTIRGTPAAGQIGPDLTRVGGRQAIAAGTLNNGVGSLAGWIAAADHIKKDNGMPSFNILSGPDLRAVATWLETLK